MGKQRLLVRTYFFRGQKQEQGARLTHPSSGQEGGRSEERRYTGKSACPT